VQERRVNHEKVKVMLDNKTLETKPAVVPTIVQERHIETIDLETTTTTKPIYDTMMRIYGFFGVVSLVFGVWMYRKRRTKRKLKIGGLPMMRV
jgi:hypothetical protein